MMESLFWEWQMLNSMNWISATFAVLTSLLLLWGIVIKINPAFIPSLPIMLILRFCSLCLGSLLLYAASAVFYRVFTFNNCESAALELRKQIEGAKSDLISKGIKFKEK
ncbi:dolichol-phosphate mannosyltransferase subunit 3 isoform X2 [Belonocnema kinseyi]|uniref:dolichol-phosphate mannosyltransferase subunit 3 isoform X2 n=1 Tax=Belonocnema kinseyi TaxID=2817044 RepID=UPI00143D3303|nr:dolichol-phosphate mannosyltransferase subunit 3 isoform X2 [Belonocnema kinseyi]